MDITKDELKKFQGLLRDNTPDQYINLQPIQRGGVLPPESRKTLLSYGDGYSMCDFCLSGRIDEIE
nr:O-phospho-L-seryl-tRNA:Cys-tRNA synthase [Candidatus Sigynarchaeota archaeon]